MHTFDIVYLPADQWSDTDRFEMACSCGIRSGAVHPSIDAARREFPHTLHLGDKRPTRAATFSGAIVYADGLPVHPVDLVGVDGFDAWMAVAR